MVAPWSLVAAGKGNVDAPLAKCSQLAVGYGNGGARPLRFRFDRGQTKDFGIFRLFVTRVPANMRSISQRQSPFDSDDGRTEEGGMGQTLQCEAPEKIGWGVKTAAIAQVLC